MLNYRVPCSARWNTQDKRARCATGKCVQWLLLAPPASRGARFERSTMRSRLVLLACCLLAGCGTWVNPSDPTASVTESMRRCEAQSLAKHPPVYAWGAPFAGLPWGPSCFRTAGGIVCQPFPSLREWPGAFDMNASARRWETRECLNALGWTWVPNSRADAPAATGEGSLSNTVTQSDKSLTPESVPDKY